MRAALRGRLALGVPRPLLGRGWGLGWGPGCEGATEVAAKAAQVPPLGFRASRVP